MLFPYTNVTTPLRLYCTIASMCFTIDSSARFLYSSGFSSLSFLASSIVIFSGTYAIGSCADVWSVTMSGITPRFKSSGYTSAAFPNKPIESGSFFFFASSTISSALSRLSVQVSRYFVSILLFILSGSISTTSATPCSIVTASGCAPPISPSPAVRRNRPRRSSLPNAFFAAAA